jgi:hypothetical protein
MDKSDIIRQAIREINPDAEFIIRGETPDTVTVDGIEWFNDTTPIATADIEAKMVEVQAEYDSQEYARNRKVEYDQLNQFELISDDSINGTTTHKDAILAIKTKYPKE